MSRERTSNALTLLAPAKVNLFLEVLGKRPDGYHDLDTVMVAVDLYDSLDFEIDESGELTMSCDRDDLSCGPDNLVLKAASRLRALWKPTAGARIHLRKRIPMQAGLAGGSSDAATTLKGLNTLWKLGLGNDELARIGAEVGSDVPFFFSPGAARCTGRGEKVEPILMSQTVEFVLISPTAGLSTAAVFGNLKSTGVRSSAEMRAALERGDIEEVGRRLHNRLQEPAEELSPTIREIRERLAAANPAGCLMTGSGTTVFAVARDRNDAIRLARMMGAEVSGLPSEEDEAGPTPAWSVGGRWTVRVVRSCLGGRHRP